jgi:hypothetical protein
MLSLISIDFFARSPLLAFPVLAMLLFIVVFVANAVRALRAPPRELDQLASLPFADEQEVDHG